VLETATAKVTGPPGSFRVAIRSLPAAPPLTTLAVGARGVTTTLAWSVPVTVAAAAGFCGVALRVSVTFTGSVPGLALTSAVKLQRKLSPPESSPPVAQVVAVMTPPTWVTLP